MAPFPEEVDVFTAPHWRMKQLVGLYCDKVNPRGEMWEGLVGGRAGEAAPPPPRSLPDALALPLRFAREGARARWMQDCAAGRGGGEVSVAVEGDPSLQVSPPSGSSGVGLGPWRRRVRIPAVPSAAGPDPLRPGSPLQGSRCQV